MAKRSTSRRVKSGKSVITLTRVVIFSSLVVLALVFFKSSNQNDVLGTNINTTPTPSSTCKFPRVNVITLSTPCDPTTRTGFRKAEFKCSDGNTGTVSRGCMNVSEALSYAQQYCYKNSACKTKSPTPTRRPEKPTPTNQAPTPTPVPPTPTPNQ